MQNNLERSGDALAVQFSLGAGRAAHIECVGAALAAIGAGEGLNEHRRLWNRTRFAAGSEWGSTIRRAERSLCSTVCGVIEQVGACCANCVASVASQATLLLRWARSARGI